MRKDAFAFLRATFYRWVQIWPEICLDLCSAPTVLAAADLHVENFGTWRDREGRLIWGVNDFDEAYPLPYTNDLVRLAASALLAVSENQLALKAKDICGAIISGYMESLKEGGSPFVLEEHHKALRAMAFGSERNPRKFWKKLLSQEKTKVAIPKAVKKLLAEVMKQIGSDYRLLSRISGLGSLGRLRVVAVGNWVGGQIAREVKALVPSACVWATERDGNRILYRSLLERTIRAPDPFLQVRENWLIRRLSPHCCRIEMKEIPVTRDEYTLLHAMGWETANVHLGSRGAADRIRRDLVRRRTSWLRDAAEAMSKATRRDWKEWREQ